MIVMRGVGKYRVRVGGGHMGRGYTGGMGHTGGMGYIGGGDIQGENRR